MLEARDSLNHKKVVAKRTGFMDLEMIILSDVSQTEKDKYHMISLTCGIF